jgi:MFS family permease
MLAGHLFAVVALYPIYRAIVANADPVRPGMLTFLVFLQMLALVLAYTPLAAFLVEAFPARIRYTSISLPYNLGNGWFGGFLPLIATALITVTGSRLGWLAYPIGLSVVTLIVGGIWVTDRVAERDIGRDDAPTYQRVPTPTQ